MPASTSACRQQHRLLTSCSQMLCTPVSLVKEPLEARGPPCRHVQPSLLEGAGPGLRHPLSGRCNAAHVADAPCSSAVSVCHLYEHALHLCTLALNGTVAWVVSCGAMPGLCTSRLSCAEGNSWQLQLASIHHRAAMWCVNAGMLTQPSTQPAAYPHDSQVCCGSSQTCMMQGRSTKSIHRIQIAPARKATQQATQQWHPVYNKLSCWRLQHTNVCGQSAVLPQLL